MRIIELGSNDSSKNLPRNNEQINKKSLEELRITDFKQGTRHPNRVNVFVNDKFQFSLDITQIVDFKLKVGNVITPRQLLRYKKASEFGKLYQRTLEWVLTRPHSVKETQDYLFRKLRQKKVINSPDGYKLERTINLPEEDLAHFSEEIISRLISKKYLDDLSFAKHYAENRFIKKGISKKRLKIELAKKGISNDIIEQVLDKRDDKEEILKIIAKKHTKYDDEKLVSYLCRQGFDYQLVQDLVYNHQN